MKKAERSEKDAEAHTFFSQWLNEANEETCCPHSE